MRSTLTRLLELAHHVTSVVTTLRLLRRPAHELR
jgi:hypothetical protein